MSISCMRHPKIWLKHAINLNSLESLGTSKEGGGIINSRFIAILSSVERLGTSKNHLIFIKYSDKTTR